MSSEYCQTIEVPEVAYTVPVGGSRDPVNEAIIIENIGTADVVNPRVTVNGLYDWSSTERMAAEITRGCTTDEEKAFAIWRWVRGKRFQRSASDRSSLHPVRLFNVYGYGICGHTAAAMKALGLAAGVPTRVHEIWGHTISEFFWDDAWHVLDGNGQVFYPKRDNRTLASVDEVGDDPWISERSTLARFTYAYQSKEDN
ncbi:MAG: transglutaminase domain-containing protein, partial [Gemmatimonadetes bacterium]|nr:transglutaminase domain-containing protein [Gemmatimonadota bacterium]